MKIYTVLQIGEHHINHCENYFLTAAIKTNWGLLPADDLAIIRVAFPQT